MRSTRTWMIRSTLLAAAVVLASASSALAMPPEQEYGGEGGYTAVWQATDLRSPDSQGGTSAQAPAQAGQDLRSPDAKIPQAAAAPERPVAVAAIARDVAPAADDGFSWSDAALGAGIALGLMLLLAGAVAVAGHYRHPPAASA
jgi:hypothetical protein